MRKWWQMVAVVAGCLAGLDAVIAQSPGVPGLGADPTFSGGHKSAPAPLPIGASSYCAPYSPPVDPAAISLPNDGSPNAFNEFDNCDLWPWPIIWGGGEGIYGFTPWINRRVALATTTPTPNATTDVGAIGQPNTIVLARRAGLDLRNPSGFAVTLGFSPTHEWRIPFEVKYLYLHQNERAFVGQSDQKGRPLLARPIQSITPGQEGETVFFGSFPGLATGGVGVEGSLQVWGLDVRGIVRTGLQWGNCDCGCAVDLPVGFRYLNLYDVINISNSTTPLNPSFGVAFQGQSFGPGNTTTVTDVFRAKNEFRGAEFGVRFECRHSSFSLVLDPRVSIGSTSRAILIEGSSVLQESSTGASQTAQGGIMAVSTNSGLFSGGEEFTILPEAVANLNWDVFPFMRLTLGYNVTYWPRVFRAADQVNRAVDLRQVPTDLSFTPGVEDLRGPFARFRERDFFLQGASIGLMFSY